VHLSKKIFQYTSGSTIRRKTDRTGVPVLAGLRRVFSTK